MWIKTKKDGVYVKSRRSGALEQGKLNLAWAAKPLNAATPELGTSVC